VTYETVYLLAPEIVLVAVAMAIYVAGAFWPDSRTYGGWALAGLVVAAVVLALAPPHHGPSGPVVFDALAQYVRWFALGAGLLLTLTMLRPTSDHGYPEYIGSLLLTIVGVMIVAAADELVLVFVGLELISIPTYILLYLGRRGETTTESAAKYFYLSVLASAVLLYGFSFLYGATGTTNLAEIGRRLAEPAANSGLAGLSKLALVLIFAGLGFRLAAVPFHFYAPDVYQGTSHPNAALLSVIPKAAALAVLLRIVVAAMPNMGTHGWHVAVGLALVTMTLGNLLALWQDNLRRLMAYSSIAHAGYLLIGLAVRLTGAPVSDRWDGVAAIVFYLTVYALATIGTFAAWTYLGRRGRQIDSLEELAGLTRTQPAIASALAIFMFSLTGIPPLAGFWGKLNVFGSALGVDAAQGLNVQLWFIGLAVVGVINSAISGAYYLRIIGVMYFRAPLGTPPAQGGRGAAATALLCALLVLAIGFYPRLLQQASTSVSQGMSLPAAAAATEGSKDQKIKGTE